MLYYVAAVLLIFIGVAHSYLGERYILIRLFRRGNLPKLFGGEAFTQNTLRFAWHLTTVAWWGFAAILIYLADQALHLQTITVIIAVTFLLHAVISFVGGRGKHFSWLIFSAIAACLLLASSR